MLQTPNAVKPRDEFSEEKRKKDDDDVQPVMKLERKDCWDVCGPTTMLTVLLPWRRRVCLQNLEPEEPVVCSGYLASFKDLQVTLWSWSMSSSPDKVQGWWLQRHARPRELKDKRETGASDAYNFVDANPHPRLWRHLAEAALKARSPGADKAFVPTTRASSS